MTDTIIYAWPPVCARGVEFTQVQPYSESVSAFGQKTRYISQHQRERKVATMIVSGMYNDGAAGGYINMFKRLMKGGTNLVRLETKPSHWNLRWGGTRGDQGSSVEWTESSTDLDWTEGSSELVWYDGSDYIGVATTDSGYPALNVDGFGSGVIVAYPDEIIRVGSSTARCLKVATSNSSGVAKIRLSEALPSGPVTIGEYPSDIYKLVDIPRSVQYAGQDFEYEFNFEQVFEDEIVGSYTEEDPWR